MANAESPKQSAALPRNDAEAHRKLGKVFQEQGRLSEAEASYRRALEIRPDYAEAHYDLANVLRDLGRQVEAEASYRRAVAIKPDYAQAHNNLGNVLQRKGRQDEAEASYRRALAIRPDFFLAHNNLGNTLRQQGRPNEAEASYRRALAIRPDFFLAHNNLGTALGDLWRLNEAETSYRRALAIKPDYAEAHFNLGNLLPYLGRPVEAEASYRRALEIKPDFAAAHSNLLYLLAYCGLGTNEQYLRQARSWEINAIPPPEREAARRKLFPHVPRDGRKLRIGYVSGDFRLHAVSYFIEPVLEHHDRNRVEVFAYSTADKQDEVTRRIRGKVDHWHDITWISDVAAVDLIGRHRIDVLLDLAGHTGGNRLGIFARRAAPVQCGYLGYFASTGLTEMDYWIGDAIVTPESHDEQYSELVWRLPRVWVSYAGSEDAPTPVWQPASDGKVWLGSFNHLAKITDRTIGLWTRVLRQIPRACLLLKTKELDDSASRKRILSAFKAQGISEARIELMGRTADWKAHMSMYDRLDIALDPVGGIGGATTTCDALWMGVPVVTLAGGRYGERMTSSIVTAIGHGDWRANDEGDYVEKVASIAANHSLRSELRSSLRDSVRRSALFDAQGLARALENAFEGMLDRSAAWQISKVR